MHTIHERFLLHYIKIKAQGINLSDILERKNISTICIYGAGMIGKLLVDEFKGTHIKIKCFIDRGAKALNRECRGFPVILPEETGELENIDAIIVTPFFEFYQIRSYLRRFTSCPILSIRDIASEALSEQEFIDFSSYLKERGVKLYVFNRPTLKMIDNPSVLEQALSRACISFKKEDKEKELFEYLFPEVAAPDAHRYILDLYSNIVFCGGNIDTEVYIKDVRSNSYNIINGYRYIPAAPDEAENTIYAFGDCAIEGSFADDAHVFGNYLQLLLNNLPTNMYHVAVNVSRLTNIHYLLAKLKSLPLRYGDIIVFLPTPERYFNYDGFYFNLPNIYAYDLTAAFSRPHDHGELFFDYAHLTFKGNEVLANAVFKYLSESGAFDAQQSKSVPFCTLPSQIDISPGMRLDSGLKADLHAYKAYLGEHQPPVKGRIGSIVMNCNPFTNGHRYLIEQAAGQVDYLYIFVVEEDRSIFPFADRFELVKEGTKDLSNVKVLKSGKFIISTVTFEGYFNKEDMPEAEIDASEDVTIFAMEIAPILNITVRFAGTEPTDKITRQYNRDMARILPNHGIEFREIERIELDGKAISASRVRSYLSENNLEAVRGHVPETTYAHLKKRADNV